MQRFYLTTAFIFDRYENFKYISLKKQRKTYSHIANCMLQNNIVLLKINRKTIKASKSIAWVIKKQGYIK